MGFVTIFLSKYIGNVVGTGYVSNGDFLVLYIFPYCIVSQLYMSNGSCCSVLCPLDTSHIVVKYGDWFGQEFFCEAKVCKDLADVR